jgi:hypothetical protein
MAQVHGVLPCHLKISHKDVDEHGYSLIVGNEGSNKLLLLCGCVTEIPEGLPVGWKGWMERVID